VEVGESINTDIAVTMAELAVFGLNSVHFMGDSPGSTVSTKGQILSYRALSKSKASNGDLKYRFWTRRLRGEKK
jgi:hypothetical protein